MTFFFVFPTFAIGQFSLAALLPHVMCPELEAGDVWKVPDDPSLFLVTAQDTSLYFFHSSVYFTWYDSYDKVKTIPASCGPQHPLVGTVQYRPGSVLLKTPVFPEVYVVTDELIPITSEEAAIKLFGKNWASYVRDIPIVELSNYRLNRHDRIDGTRLLPGMMVADASSGLLAGERIVYAVNPSVIHPVSGVRGAVIPVAESFIDSLKLSPEQQTFSDIEERVVINRGRGVSQESRISEVRRADPFSDAVIIDIPLPTRSVNTSTAPLPSTNTSTTAVRTTTPSQTTPSISSGGGGGGGGGGGSSSNGSTPTVSVQSTSSNGDESTATATFVFALSSSASNAVTVSYAVSGGTASGSGTDYTLASGTATISAGQTTTSVSMSIIDDSLDEADETVIVTISNPSNATLGSNTSHTYTITDNDSAPTIGFRMTTSSGNENVTPVSIMLDLSAVSSRAVTVSYSLAASSTATGSGTDYTLANGTATVAAGDTSTTISLVIVNDALDEADETVNIDIASPTNATLAATTTHTYTILDDDSPPEVQFSAGASSANESSANALIVLSISATSTKTVTITYQIAVSSTATSTGGSADISLGTTSSTIAAGASTTSIAFTVTNDSLYETNETIILTITGATNATASGTLEYVYTILNDDTAPSVGFSAATGSGSESVTSTSFILVLSTTSARDAVITYAIAASSTATSTGGSADVTLTTTSTTISAGSTMATISFVITDDATLESNETVIIEITTSTNATVGSTSTFTYTIQDNDTTPPKVAFQSATSSGYEGTSPVTIVVALSATSSQQITVQYSAVASSTATGGGTDYTLTTGTSTILAGSSTTSISFAIIDDSSDENSEIISIILANPVNATIGTTTEYVYTIFDNDDQYTQLSSTHNLGFPATFGAGPWGAAMDFDAAAISPDGTKFAAGYRNTTGAQGTPDSSRLSLWTVSSTSGSTWTEIWTSTTSVWSEGCDFHPNGLRIYCASQPRNSTSTTQLLVFNASNGNLLVTVNVSTTAGYNLDTYYGDSARVSPDGRWVAMTQAYDNGNNQQSKVIIIGADSTQGDYHQFVTSTITYFDDELAFSLDGTSLYYGFKDASNGRVGRLSYANGVWQNDGTLSLGVNTYATGMDVDGKGRVIVGVFSQKNVAIITPTTTWSNSTFTFSSSTAQLFGSSSNLYEVTADPRVGAHYAWFTDQVGNLVSFDTDTGLAMATTTLNPTRSLGTDGLSMTTLRSTGQPFITAEGQAWTMDKP